MIETLIIIAIAIVAVAALSIAIKVLLDNPAEPAPQPEDGLILASLRDKNRRPVGRILISAEYRPGDRIVIDGEMFTVTKVWRNASRQASSK